MTAPTPQSQSDEDRRRIDLTRAQQWVLHHVMVSRCEQARADRRTPRWWTVDVIEKLEDDVFVFSPFEARRLWSDLAEYAGDPGTDPREAATARAVVEELEDTFGIPREE